MGLASYHEPRTVEEALKRLGEAEGSRCIAGGQTLVAMMNARLVEPAALVSLSRIDGLAAIGWEADGTLRLGAMATHAVVAAEARIRAEHPLIAATAAAIAHQAIRNFGTIGGAAAHGDPSSDYPAALLAADAVIVAAGPGGKRPIAARDFFLDFLTTALAPGEIIVEIRVPQASANGTGGYFKFARADGDYATVSVAAGLGLAGGICRHLAVALGACGAVPLRLPEAERALIGRALDPDAVAGFGAALAARCDPVDDVRGSAAYRKAMVPRLVRRALLELQAKAEAGR